MLAAAQAVLKNAYAPYSNFLVSSCVKSTDNQFFVGCNVENAAYPLSLCAEACAISAMYVGGKRKIVEALVLVDDNKICPPCGACRQRFLECSSLDMRIHLC